MDKITFKFIDKKDIKKYFEGDTVQCLICFKWYKSLCSHLRVHDITVDQYKTKFGLPFSKGLCGNTVSNNFRENAKRLRMEGKILTGIISEEHAQKVHKTGHRRITPAHSIDRGIFFAELGKRNKYHTLNFKKCWSLFNNGLTQKDIGKKYNVSQTTVSRFMRKDNKYQPTT